MKPFGIYDFGDSSVKIVEVTKADIQKDDGYGYVLFKKRTLWQRIKAWFKRK